MVLERRRLWRFVRVSCLFGVIMAWPDTAAAQSVAASAQDSAPSDAMNADGPADASNEIEDADAAASDALMDGDAPVDAAVPLPLPEPPGLTKHFNEVVTGDVRLVMSLPDGASIVNVARNQMPGLPDIPGVKQEFYHTFLRDSGSSSSTIRVEVGCLSAPVTVWLSGSGQQAAVFDHMDEYARVAMSEFVTIENFQSETMYDQSPQWWRYFSLRARDGATKKEGSKRVIEALPDAPVTRIRGVGRHMLGFVEEPARVFVCSSWCLEPDVATQGVCTKVVDTMRLEGNLVPEPQASRMDRLLNGLRNNRSAVVGVVCGLVLGIVGFAVTMRGVLMRPAR